MLNEVRFQEEEQRLPERHQQHGLAGAAAGFLAFPTREGRAGWSARQDHSRDGGGGWQGWAPAHPAGVSPGVVGWKGMTTELAEQAGSAQGGFGSRCSGEETDLTEMSLRGSLSQSLLWQGEETLHLISAPSLQGCATAHSICAFQPCAGLECSP